MSTPTRTDLLRSLAKAERHGRLGLFVGSGFSKAISPRQALTWGGLLQNVAKDLGIPDLTSDNVPFGASFPEIATMLVNNLAASEEISLEDAERRVRISVCRLTGFKPDPAASGRARKFFETLTPAWVVTTNYDLLLESVIPNAEFLTPEQPISLRSHVIPVYHMHGHRLAPASLVITNEDYGKLFAHVDYRHQRLAALFAESTTLIIGYSLTDFNVQVCLNRSSDFSPRDSEYRRDGQGQVVTVKWMPPGSTPRLEPYLHRGRLVIETSNVLEFLEELSTFVEAVTHEWETFETEFAKLIQNGTFGSYMIVAPEDRLSYIQFMKDVPFVRHRFEMEEQLLRALEDKDSLAHGGSSGWAHYAGWLDTLLDFFEHWPLGTMPPQLFEVLAKSLLSISYNLDTVPSIQTRGKAWAASARWHARKALFCAPERKIVRQALISYAERAESSSLKELLDSIPQSD